MPTSIAVGTETRVNQAPRGLEADQTRVPYVEAVEAYAERQPGRYHVPGHKGGRAFDGGLAAAIGQRPLELDVPLIIHGIDVGPSPTPLEQAQELAARAYGARRTWFLTNGATQGNHALLLAMAQLGRGVVVQRNAHASTIDGLVLAGLRPTFVGPEVNMDLGIAHCVTPQALELTLADSPDIGAAIIVSPTYFGAVADVRALADVAHGWDVPLIVDEAWGAHFPFHPVLPPDALASGADMVLSGTHKLVGSLTQSAMLHLSENAHPRLSEGLIDRSLTLVSSTSPSSLLTASLDAGRRLMAVYAYDLLDEAIPILAEARRRIRDIPGLDVLDTTLADHRGVFDFDPLRLAIDVRGVPANGFELAKILRERSDVHLELVAQNMLVALFGIAEPVGEGVERLIAALTDTVAQVSAPPGERRAPRPTRALPPPRWGALAVTPREAYLSMHRAVPIDQSVGRISAESLAAYPPGIPNVMPGEQITADTVSYLRSVLAQGGVVRGASDPSLATLRVVDPV